MKAFVLPVLFLIAFASGNGLAAVPGSDPGEAGVREVENGWSKAFVTGDTGYLEALLDPAYVSVGSHGDARSKADIIALAGRYAAEHPGSQATPLPPTSKIEIKGSTAIVVHHNDTDISIDVFYYAADRWRAWYSQHTFITPAK
jgi:hypothetical protein